MTSHTSSPHILVVEDDKGMNSFLLRLLKKEGYRAVGVASGEEAVTAMEGRDFDLVLCDIGLPGMSGIDLLKLNTGRNGSPAFVMVTAIDDRAMAVETLRLGAHGYIIKPFKPHELLISVESGLHYHRQTMENRQYRESLENLVRMRTAELNNKVSKLRQSEKQLQAALRDLRQSEEANRRQSDYFRTIIQSIPYPFYVVNVDSYRVVMANAAATADRNQDVTCYELTHQRTTPCETRKHRCPLSEVKRTGRPVVVEHIHLEGDGHEHVHEVHGYPLFDSEGRLYQMVEFSIDITERKKAEQALKESEQRLRDILDAIQTGVVIIDPATHEIMDANPAAARMFGAGREKIVGRECHRFLCPAVRGKCPVTDLGLPVDSSERKMITGSGETIPILKTVSPIRLEGKECLLETFVDISRQKRAENSLKTALAESQRLAAELEKAYDELKAAHSQIIQQEKMASIGQLAAGVAHEINNPMGFISSNLNTLGRYSERLQGYLTAQDEVVKALPEESEVRQRLRRKRRDLKVDYIIGDLRDLITESLEGADRVKNIVRNLKSFSRIDEEELQPADLNECLESTLSIIWNELKYKATVHKDYGELPPTFCNPQQLNQVFMNILVNAAHAIEKQGEISIRTRHWDDAIEISISDTGGGMPPEVRDRIFEPFYTTKQAGQGTGLGLSIVNDIVRNHQGEIAVASGEGKGTTFTVRLPVKTEAEKTE